MSKETTARQGDKEKVEALVKSINKQLRAAKTLIKDFEREARADGMPVGELLARKRALAVDLNLYIRRKEDCVRAHACRGTHELTVLAQTPAAHLEAMSNTQLMDGARTLATSTDQTLDRTLQVVTETQAVGMEMASTLHEQRRKLDKIMDGLDGLRFTLRKATQVVRDIARGLLTDKCIAFLLLLVVCGVVAIIVLKVVNPKKVKEGAVGAYNQTMLLCMADPECNKTLYDTTGAIQTAVNATGFGRRALLGRALHHVLEFNATLT
ncbi:hypothetical protein HYH03_009697 [Edaphochlamys debaryana]|uniref:t-SNARE coiled-coil homology domain-containing protein n=1 Tax=Edaphochlamys debaryana TaxID=47281 RepID=A0A836BWR5_9CHLO|nr:hypothetical protein HYH03_009697 [Edaphochlamys debaryana]|eukprot:KAG2491966.1 hypothetical protein HYH03_009697 [Edaphochlamys debaryana]